MPKFTGRLNWIYICPRLRQLEKHSDEGKNVAEFADLARWLGRSNVLPPVSSQFELKASAADRDEPAAEPSEIEPQPISAFTCVIEYGEEPRLITCRRYDVVGEYAYVGAICHLARGYRQFRCDRILAVSDATTGESLGDGTYFARFEANSQRESNPTWGLTPSRRSTLIAGINALAFMARCDGHWHPLEGEVIEKFVCSMWLRKEWDGEPPISEILTHAHRLAPDADTFFKALRCYAVSETSTLVLTRAISDLIAADGVICSQEWNWGAEVEAFFCEYQEENFRRLFLGSEERASN